MDKFAAALEKGIVRELEHALFLTRVIGVVLFLAGLWVIPGVWKVIIFGPFFVAPLLVVLTRHLPASWTEPDRKAQAAERRRITPRPAPPLHTR